MGQSVEIKEKTSGRDCAAAQIAMTGVYFMRARNKMALGGDVVSVDTNAHRDVAATTQSAPPWDTGRKATHTLQ